jgi:hypothetical protein
MKFRMMLISALVASASAQAAEPAGSGSPIEISATGEGTWYVRCDIESGGNSGLRELNKGRPAYRDDRMQSAACHYESNKRGLTIKIVGAGWACPFKGAAEGDCTLVDSRGSGEFRIKRSK